MNDVANSALVRRVMMFSLMKSAYKNLRSMQARFGVASASADAEPDAPAVDSMDKVQIDGLRCLLAEDELIVGLGMQSILEETGVAVVGPATTLAEAIRLSDSGNLDAAVVDMNLQGEMADDLVDKLNERGVPVVVVTGYEFSPELANKVAAVLPKPIRAKELLQTLRSIARVH